MGGHLAGLHLLCPNPLEHEPLHLRVDYLPAPAPLPLNAILQPKPDGKLIGTQLLADFLDRLRLTELDRPLLRFEVVSFVVGASLSGGVAASGTASAAIVLLI